MIIRSLIPRFLRNYISSGHSFYSTSVAASEVVVGQVKSPRAETPQLEIVKYFENAGQDVHNIFPPSLLRRKASSSTDCLYVTDTRWAQVIIDHFKRTKINVPIVELNPGIGILTKELLTNTKTAIHCLEGQKLFKSQMEELFLDHIDRLSYSEGDLMKMVIRDNMNQYQGKQRIPKFLGPEKRNWEDDPVLKVIGGVGTPDFFKHLINSLVFQNNLFSQGRCEFLLFVPPSVLLRYICNERAGYFSYRPRAVLFQILFEFEILELMPRKDFLPWVNCPKKNSKLSKLNEVHADYLYLVRMAPRRDLLTLCPPEHLYTLSFFVKQVMSSGKHRVIPYLEKWIENCGVRIILNGGSGNPAPPDPPVVNGERLPDFVGRSKPLLATPKELPNINIFTEFGEIPPAHIFYLFHELINWPEYQNSSFVSLMQQHHMKVTEPRDPDERRPT